MLKLRNAFLPSILLLSLPHWAFASPAKIYVEHAVKAHCNFAITPADLNNPPMSDNGKVIELRGTVVGTAGESDNLYISLKCPGINTDPILNHIPKSAVPILVEGQSVRVLAKLVVSPYSNDPQFVVLDAALDADVKAYVQQLNASQAQAQLERTRERDNRYSQSPSRGGFSRMMEPNATANFEFAQYNPQLDSRTRGLFIPYFNFITKENSSLTAPTVGKITFYLLQDSESYGVDPRLIVAMIIAESDFDPKSTSSTGAAGLGQLMPGTGKDMGLTNPYSISQNLNGSVHYLRSCLDKFVQYANPNGSLSDQQITLAMASYNAGPNAVAKYGGVPPYKETQHYVKKVLGLYHELCGENSGSTSY